MFALVTALLGVLGVPPTRESAASPSSSAALLVQQGKQHEKDGQELVALKRYGDAITIDPISEEAYLALGSLRTKRNELFEAEEVFTVGITRVPGTIDLFVARGRVRRFRGRLLDAEDDLRHAWRANGTDASAREIVILRERIAVEREARAFAAQLASFRRLLAIARERNDASLEKEASVQARALGLYLGEVDPVLGGRALPGPSGKNDAERRSLASIARRGG